MNLLVFEFGADSLESALKGIQELASDHRSCEMSLLYSDEEKDMMYRRSSLGLEEAAELLDRGIVSSVCLTDKSGNALFLLNRPTAFGEVSSFWYGYGEKQEDASFGSIARLKEIEGLRFIAISLEDALDLDLETLTLENFPWEHWRLLTAAFRQPNGTWYQRLGSAAEKLGSA